MRAAPDLQVKKPIECSAPTYVLYLMEWIESQLDDESVRREHRSRLPVVTVPAGLLRAV
jgi:hypothetical protein